MSKDIIVVIGAGGIGTAIARRQGFGRTILLADFNEQTLAKAAEDLTNGSYAVVTQQVDEAVLWAKRGARVNTISPGIIMTPLANDELSGPRGEG